MRLFTLLGLAPSAMGWQAVPTAGVALRRVSATHMQMSERPLTAAAAAIAAFSVSQAAEAARSGGRVGGRVGGGGGMRGGGGGSYRGGGGGVTNVYMAPRPFFSPFGFSPFGFSPFGFGFGFGLPFPLLALALGGLAVTSFRSSRGIEAYDVADEKAGAALCLQVACYCPDRQNSLYGKLNSIARVADTNSAEGLQSLVSDTCLAILRSSNDWLAARTESETAGLLKNDVESTYNRLVIKERSKWEVEQKALTRTAPGQPTYMVATLVVLLRNGKSLAPVSTNADLRDSLQSLAAEVSVVDNLLGAEVLWTPEDTNDVMDRDELFLNFPELVSI